MKVQRPITTFFGKKAPSPVLTDAEMELKRRAHEKPCDGLSDATWNRPRSKYSIEDCILGSTSRYHGAPRRDILCKEIFKGRSETELDDEERERLNQERRARATWVIERETDIKAIFSTKCLKVVHRSCLTDLVVCSECLALKHDSSLLYALNRSYAAPETRKHIRKDYLADDLYQAARRNYPALDLAATSLEKASRLGDKEFWQVFAVRAVGGHFDHLEVFKGLLKAVAIRTERTLAGKGTTGMHFQEYFDHFVMTLAAISPQAAQFFTENLAGRSLRSIRHLRNKNGAQLEGGISLKNFERIVEHLKKIEYDGPLALGTDETKVLPTLRVHNDHIVGAHGEDIPFSSTEELTQKCKDIMSKNNLAKKVCDPSF